MCGRYSLYESMDHYLRELAPEQHIISYVDPHPIERYNIAPTTRVPVLHTRDDGLHIDSLRWGWAPPWAKGKRPDPINARGETVASSKFFKQLWPQGRLLVPANGWFEWVKSADDPKKKQPYYIRLNSQAPMFFAGLGQVHPGLEPHEGDGFVIITDASDEGMVDIHDRRPVVLRPEDARAWLEGSLSEADAQLLVRQGCRPVADFEWFEVGQAVGNVRNQGEGLLART